MSPSETRLGARAFNLPQSWRVEVSLAAGLAILSLVLVPATGHSWIDLVVDLGACALAVVAAKWPRVGGIAVGLYLAFRLALPYEDNGVLGEYAPLFTLLGVGMRGERSLRLVLTIFYLPVMWWLSWTPARPMVNFMWGFLAWVSFAAMVWLVGNTYYALAEAQERARTAELVLQRQVLARELHDTVARSFTKVSMVAERARLRGVVSDQDLDQISEESARGVEELRWVMNLLRDPSVSVEALSAGRTSLAGALTEARDGLAKDGFSTTVSVEGDLNRLPAAQSETLAAVTAEAAANMVKHGDPRQPSGIVVQVGEADAELAFINAAAPATTPDDDGRERLGLWGMRQRLGGLGGSVQAGAEDQRWVTRVRLPLTSETGG
ncbi:histidine kinase [Propionicimonas sp.]|uniref:sensor histidine kinase n=1 Tax=Propionicimonas sp. TaxID=1955623 RepID=UPI0017EE5CED|nr:histidine kinase [Propionicimonas sp.]MBU3976282.1 hypothetical protein [Actinomycetota bacterium]MBA3022124.1 hypothetical protein [Propionicimonas sp.]MBU3987439.1 hypothetical protein [Actinomycetota bacterium]MBU4006616.1 hypothetical protein [Actinomycetota bacterium]MBU4065221.1 hypothetical protein [Actinomycetota bacterium]